MAKNRYIGEYPVIGIRPTIDGRRGPLKVRESLEEQTMAMANAAKELFESNLRYSNGEPVKVIIADTTIGSKWDGLRRSLLGALFSLSVLFLHLFLAESTPI